MTNRYSLLALATAAIAAVGTVSAIAQTSVGLAAGPLTYDSKGMLVAPADYRDWVFLSSGLDMTYGPAMPPPGVHRFDNVFVNPEAYRAFKSTGAWPDKTVMVLEVRNAAQDLSINKAGHVQTDVAAIEIHAKDQAKGGWAFYGVGAGGAVNRFPEKSSCTACHGTSAAVDTTFVQFYPTLIDAAKKAGTFKEGR